MNISIRVEPLAINTGSAYGGPSRNINGDIIQSYQHRITMGVGFDTAEVSFPVKLASLHDWIDGALGRDITVYDESLSTVWNGFVNEVSINLGPSEIRLGPLSDIANKVRVLYQGISWDVTPPIPASQEVTAYATNDASIDQYFTSEFTVSGGQGTSTEMLAIRDLYLQEHAWPATRQDVSIPGGNPPNVTLSCLGYAHTLDFYYYTNDTASGLVNASQKVSDVISADPNSFLSVGDIETNTFQVPDYEDGFSTARTIVDHVLSYGDSSNNRYLFGVYENREARYKKISSLISLGIEVTTRHPTVHPVGNPGINIPQTQVRPGTWARILDLPGVAGPDYRDDDRANPKVIFIESVEFSAPNSLTITSSKFDAVAAMLARIGLLNELI